MWIGLHLLLTSSASAGQTWHALSTLRIRARPSTGAEMVRFAPMGTALEQVGRLGNWVQVEEGWVHHSLLGSDWVPPPSSEGLRGEHGLIVGWTPSTVFEATLDTALQICATPLDDRPAPACFRAPVHRSVRDAEVQEQLDDTWDRHGRALQAYVQGALPLTGSPVRPEDWFTFEWSHLVTPNGTDRLLTGVVRHGMVWPAPDFTRSQVSALRLNDAYLLVQFDSMALDGCCATRTAQLVPTEPQVSPPPPE